jgi:hypothetical protein
MTINYRVDVESRINMFLGLLAPIITSIWRLARVSISDQDRQKFCFGTDALLLIAEKSLPDS